MKKQTLISIYNTATVIFALMTIISLGSFGTAPLQSVVTNTMLFGLLTYVSYEKETQLRASLKRKHKKAALSVYSGKQMGKAA